MPAERPCVLPVSSESPLSLSLSLWLEPKLPLLLKMLVYSQQQLAEKVKFPKMNLQGQFEDSAD
jgi:hypothetical protein